MQLCTAAAILGLIFILSIPAAALGQSVTVNWTDQRQSIDGFGAFWGWRTNWYGTMFDEATMDTLFSQTSGAGFDFVRTRINEDQSQWPAFFTQLQTFMQRARARNPNVELWAAPWRIPAAWIAGSTLDPAHYQDYANHLRSYVQQAAGYGLTIYAVSILNEPDNNFEGQVLSPSTIKTFIRDYLGPTFAANGITAKIMTPETTEWGFMDDYGNDALQDSAAASYVGIVASHDYANQGYPPYAIAKNLNKKLWETEVSLFPDSGSFFSMSDALAWATRIHNGMTNGEINAWHYWGYWEDNNSYGGLVYGGDQGVVGPVTMQYSRRLFAMGNFSKFLGPGWVRVTVPNMPSGFQISAYKNPSTGDFAVVTINYNVIPTPITFTMNGLGSITTAVTPWVTSDTLNLAAQSPISPSGASFTATVPVNSVTTFTGRGSGGDTTAPAPPTALSVR